VVVTLGPFPPPIAAQVGQYAPPPRETLHVVHAIGLPALPAARPAAGATPLAVGGLVAGGALLALSYRSRAAARGAHSRAAAKPIVPASSSPL